MLITAAYSLVFMGYSCILATLSYRIGFLDGHCSGVEETAKLIYPGLRKPEECVTHT